MDTGEKIKKGARQSGPDSTPDPRPKPSSDSTPDPHSQSLPDSTPDSRPKPSSDSTPDPHSQSLPDSTPDPRPKSSPNSTLDPQPKSSPNSTLDPQPKSSPNSTLDPQPKSSPNSTLDPRPKARLPHGWVVRVSTSRPDRLYYFNRLSGDSTWDLPALLEAQTPQSSSVSSQPAKERSRPSQRKSELQHYARDRQRQKLLKVVPDKRQSETDDSLDLSCDDSFPSGSDASVTSPGSADWQRKKTDDKASPYRRGETEKEGTRKRRDDEASPYRRGDTERERERPRKGGKRWNLLWDWQSGASEPAQTGSPLPDTKAHTTAEDVCHNTTGQGDGTAEADRTAEGSKTAEGNKTAEVFQKDPGNCGLTAEELNIIRFPGLTGLSKCKPATVSQDPFPAPGVGSGEATRSAKSPRPSLSPWQPPAGQSLLSPWSAADGMGNRLFGGGVGGREQPGQVTHSAFLGADTETRRAQGQVTPSHCSGVLTSPLLNSSTTAAAQCRHELTAAAPSQPSMTKPTARPSNRTVDGAKENVATVQISQGFRPVSPQAGSNPKGARAFPEAVPAGCGVVRPRAFLPRVVASATARKSSCLLQEEEGKQLSGRGAREHSDRNRRSPGDGNRSRSSGDGIRSRSPVNGNVSRSPVDGYRSRSPSDRNVSPCDRNRSISPCDENVSRSWDGTIRRPLAESLSIQPPGRTNQNTIAQSSSGRTNQNTVGQASSGPTNQNTITHISVGRTNQNAVTAGRTNRNTVAQSSLGRTNRNAVAQTSADGTNQNTVAQSSAQQRKRKIDSTGSKTWESLSPDCLSAGSLPSGHLSAGSLPCGRLSVGSGLGQRRPEGVDRNDVGSLSLTSASGLLSPSGQDSRRGDHSPDSPYCSEEQGMEKKKTKKRKGEGRRKSGDYDDGGDSVAQGPSPSSFLGVTRPADPVTPAEFARDPRDEAAGLVYRGDGARREWSATAVQQRPAASTSGLEVADDDVAMEIDEDEGQIMMDLQELRDNFTADMSVKAVGMLTESARQADTTRPLTPQRDLEAASGKLVYVVVDTNVLIGSLSFVQNLRDMALKDYGRPYLVVPWVVLQELDSMKGTRLKRQSHERKAQDAVRYLHRCLVAQHPRVKGQTPAQASEGRDSLAVQCNDDHILQCCLQYQDKHGKELVILLTEDLNLINKAVVMAIQCFSTKTLQPQLTDVSVNSSLSPLPPGSGGSDHKSGRDNSRAGCDGPQSGRDDSNQQSRHHDASQQSSRRDNSQQSNHHDNSQQSNCQDDCQQSNRRDDSQKQRQQRITVDEVMCGLMSVLRGCLPALVETEMEQAFADLWTDMVYRKPPWSAHDLALILQKHWIAVFGLKLDRHLQTAVTHLAAKLRPETATGLSLEEVEALLGNSLQLVRGVHKYRTCGLCVQQLQRLQDKLRRVKRLGSDQGGGSQVTAAQPPPSQRPPSACSNSSSSSAGSAARRRVSVEMVEDSRSRVRTPTPTRLSAGTGGGARGRAMSTEGIEPHTHTHARPERRTPLNTHTNNNNNNNSVSKTPPPRVTSPPVVQMATSPSADTTAAIGALFQGIWSAVFNCCNNVERMLVTSMSDAEIADTTHTLSLLVPLVKQIRCTFDTCLSFSPVCLERQGGSFQAFCSCLNEFYTRTNTPSPTPSLPPVAPANMMAFMRETPNRMTLFNGLRQLDDMIVQLHGLVSRLPD